MFQVSGDMDIVYDATTYRDLFTSGTNKAIRLSVEGETLIGATAYNSLQIDIANVTFEEWTRNIDLDGIVRQTIGFTAHYDTTATEMIAAIVTNATSTNYNGVT